MNDAVGYQLSVIICSHDRYEILAEAIGALANSKGFRESSCELVVVENTPANRRQKISVPNLPNVRVEICDDVGLSHARNHGVRATASPIIAFLDDDAIVSDQWGLEMVKAFEAPDVMIVGGRVVPRYPSKDMPHWFDDKLAGHLSAIDWGPRPRKLRRGEWIAGANMAFRRSVFDEFGLFNVELGRKGGGSLLSNEEIALIERVGLHHVLYHPDALVEHMIPAERLNPHWFRRRVYWQAVSDMVAGLAPLTEKEAADEYGRLISRLEAERRNLNALFHEPETYEHFAIQLRAIYLAAIVFGAGGP